MTAEELLRILAEIKKLIRENTDSEGAVNFDGKRVAIALDLAKTELTRSLR